MTVTELIEQLKKFNPEYQVWMSKDSEGNDFKPVDEIKLGEVDEIDDEVLVIWPGWYVEN